MKNRLEDLANHLFLQLERLNDDELDQEALRAEIARAGALTGVARELIGVGRLAVDARRVAAEQGVAQPPLRLLGLDQ
jgi:hypothetical protein